MANELTISIGIFQFSKGGVIINRSPGSQSVTVTGADAMHGSQAIGTAAENVIQGDVSTPGFGLYHNCDATNYIELGYDSSGFVACATIPAGKWLVWYPPTGKTQVQAQANTGTCLMEYIIVEV